MKIASVSLTDYRDQTGEAHVIERALTEASTRRRAVALWRPTDVPAGAIWARKSFTITGLIGEDSSAPHEPLGTPVGG